MKIATIIKQVPDSNATLRVRPDGRGIDPSGLKLVIDPFDEFGVELAIQLREKRNDVDEIVVLTLGPDKSAEALRVALAMGADRAVHLCDPSFESHNEVFAASLLAAAIGKQSIGFDLILCGKNSIDLDSGAVGPSVAEFLNFPHLGAVVGLEVDPEGKSFQARRRIEGAEEVVRGPLPVVLTIEKGLVEARYPSLPNLMKAKKKPVTVLTAADVDVDGGLVGATRFEAVAPPTPRPDCRFLEGDPPVMARELVRLLREEAKVL